MCNWVFYTSCTAPVLLLMWGLWVLVQQVCAFIWSKVLNWTWDLETPSCWRQPRPDGAFTCAGKYGNQHKAEQWSVLQYCAKPREGRSTYSQYRSQSGSTWQRKQFVPICIPYWRWSMCSEMYFKSSSAYQSRTFLIKSKYLNQCWT